MKDKILYIGGVLVALGMGVSIGSAPATTETPKPQESQIEVTQAPFPTTDPTSIPSPIVTIARLTATPVPTKIICPTTTPAVQQLAPQQEPSEYSCNCSKTCTQMSSCEEAQYQLNNCGCGARDGDSDGIACDTQCQ